ncbi:MAG: (1-_4)-alpha-D-glucan 1-alpha-D-glucosylmutase [Clostridia bacterium]|nr:(1->4)-alpha-D-glucan 1-alpha-D-glucosylmutase [Clostridia bacterium]
MINLRIPTTTYRLQFNKNFGFTDAQKIVPYLKKLGISDVYASPLLEATKESPHGYDVTNPNNLNPNLGNREDFNILINSLQDNELGLLLDFVPNHMAANIENPWWKDVLKNGRESQYASYFDIDWEPIRQGLNNKVLVPILGAPFSEVLENEELKITIAKDGFWINYYDNRLPINYKSSIQLLLDCLEKLVETVTDDYKTTDTLKDIFDSLPKLSPLSEDLPNEFNTIWDKFWNLYTTSPEIKRTIDDELNQLNGKKDNPKSFNYLEKILANQSYRLSFWRVANEDINYRRFFDVSDLVSIHMEDKEVFESMHSLIFKLINKGQVTGLRLDHIDGLYDPKTHIERLQKQISSEETTSKFYILVEKILGEDEKLPKDWPVYGTTGYDFLNILNKLFCDKNGTDVLNNLYINISNINENFRELVYKQKKKIMNLLFKSEIRNLVHQLSHLAENSRQGHDLTFTELKKVLVEITSRLSIYRTYINDLTVSEKDSYYIEQAVNEAIRNCPSIKHAGQFLKNVLLLNNDNLNEKEEWLRFVMRWQQFTGPIMAKGFEDTALYVYNRLVSLNEVGGDPETIGISIEEFHHINEYRQKNWPHTISATTTHDTKRSEDVRMRINVISEIPNAWAEKVEQWHRMNKSKKIKINNEAFPEENTELLIYQTLLGTWPLEEKDMENFHKRIEEYLIKALREAKIYTNWLEPNNDYETAIKKFLSAILEDNKFVQDLLEFSKLTSYYGALNSLSQLLLKITSPGIPDFYQGTELWNFSLVDPDNRRPIDFEKHNELLTKLLEKEKNIGELALTQELLSNWKNGEVKLYLTYKALNFRKNSEKIFKEGEYIPVKVQGTYEEHICSFLRKLENNWVLIVVPRLMVGLQEEMFNQVQINTLTLKKINWKETSLLLPEEVPEKWYNIFTGEEVTKKDKNIKIDQLFKNFPVALLLGK